MNGIGKICCIGFLFIASIFTAVQTAVVDTNQLTQWAETQGLGYKTANLMQLKQLLQDLHGTLPAGYDVQVPQFYGISAQQIEQVLLHKNTIQPNVPKHRKAQARIDSNQLVDLKNEWAAILKNTVTPEMLKNHTVTPEFIKECEELAQKIEDKFSEAAYVIQKMPFTFKDHNKCWIDLASVGFDPEVASTIENLVSTVALNKGLVTLRSTGLREDTDKVANAGGNESCEIVRATLAEAVKNMGEVAASYLKAKSLLQRSGKDEKIFEQPQMPVLLQEVVGEHTGNPVISCVAYSRERQGNTPGVSSLQCNYGHGKSVVDSLFPVDTYYIDDATKTVFPVIRIKTKRMVPHFDTTFELKEVDNSKDMQTKSALDTNAQLAIHLVMMELEKAYGRPMDVELVVDPIKKIIYLVQARPIVYETQKIQPIYVSEAVTFEPTKIITAQKIYVSGAVYFLKPDELLVTENLESALKAVLDREAKQQQDPKVIVVKEPGAITSHAGATLAGKGIVLLQRNDTKPLSDLLKKESRLLVDSQRGLIIDITGDERFSTKDQTTLLNKGLLKEGWYSHPIPAVMSIEASVDQQKIDAALADYGKREESMPDTTMSDLLNLLKEAPEQQANAALETILIRVAKEIDKLEQEKACKDVEATCKNNADQAICKMQARMGKACFKEHAAEETIKNLKLVLSELLTFADDVKQVLKLPSRSMQRLLPINFLEALLVQDLSSNAIHAFSLANIKTSYDKEIDFMLKKLASAADTTTIDTTLFSNRNLLLIAQKGADASPTKEAEQEWIALVAQLGKTLKPEELNDFITMVNTIDDLGALPTWIYARVIPTAEKETNSAQLSNELRKEFNTAKAMITKLQTIKQQLAAIDYNHWQDPKKFEKNLKTFKDQMLDYFESATFLSIFAKDSNQLFAQIVAVPVMHQLVDVFDTIIKTLKASNQYENDTAKVKDFKILIQHYFALLSNWAPLISDDILQSFNLKTTHYKHKELVTQYLTRLKQTLDAMPINANQFSPTSGFDSQSAVLGSLAIYANFKRCTLENIFTIVHQSLELTLASLAKKINSVVVLPEIMMKADKVLRRPLIRAQEQADITGIFIDKDKIIVYYNLPLGEHSATLMLSWFKHKPGVEIKYTWYATKRGHAEDAAFTGMLMGAAYGIQVKDVVIDPPAATLTHYVDQENLLNHISDYMNVVTYCQIPAEHCPDDYDMKYLKKIAHEALNKDVPDLERLLVSLNLLNDQEFQNLFGKEKIIEICLKLLNDENAYIRSNVSNTLYALIMKDKNLLNTLWDKVKDKDSASRLTIFNLLKKYLPEVMKEFNYSRDKQDQAKIDLWKPLLQQWWAIASEAYNRDPQLTGEAWYIFTDLNFANLIDNKIIVKEIERYMQNNDMTNIKALYTIEYFLNNLLIKFGISSPNFEQSDLRFKIGSIERCGFNIQHAIKNGSASEIQELKENQLKNIQFIHETFSKAITNIKATQNYVKLNPLT